MKKHVKIYIFTSYQINLLQFCSYDFLSRTCLYHYSFVIFEEIKIFNHFNASCIFFLDRERNHSLFCEVWYNCSKVKKINCFKFNNKKNLKACNFIKKRLQHKCFPVSILKFLGTPIRKNICRRLLL